MIISKEEIASWDSKYRLKFMNSVSGYKGVHLIGTKGKHGLSNLAMFSSIVHISSSPARVGFVMRPLTVPRHTYKNILESQYFTINQVHKSFLEQAHFTSAKFESNESEFEKCNLKEAYINDFYAPFVAESHVKIGLKFLKDIEITEGDCHLMVGEVQYVDIKEEYIEEDGQLDFEKAHSVCVTGLNQYSSVKKYQNLPYARPNNLPNFGSKKRPDNTVFDKESQTYNAKLLPYGSNVAAPRISSNNLSQWKNRGINGYNHVLKSKIEKIKEEYNALLEEYKTNEILYHAQYDFEPIIGEVYHLYEKDNKDEKFLSIIPPGSWKQPYLGSFRLSSEKVWIKMNEIIDPS